MAFKYYAISTEGGDDIPFILEPPENEKAFRKNGAWRKHCFL
jgi:hypothetical protein